MRTAKILIGIATVFIWLPLLIVGGLFWVIDWCILQYNKL